MANGMSSEGREQNQTEDIVCTNSGSKPQTPPLPPPPGYSGNRNGYATPKEEKRKNALETIIWLVVILGMLALVLQGTGYLQLFSMKSGYAAGGLLVIAIAMAVAAAYSYLQGIKLRAAIKRLTEQQKRNKQSVTLPSVDGESENEGAAETDDVYTEQVRFSAVIEERQRLARELHDAVSQQLFAISMTATAVSRTLEKDWERAKRQVQLIEEMAAVAQSEMRALLLHLRPVHLDGKNLAQALRSLVEELKQKVPMAITLEVDETIKIDSAAEDHLFRIAQEALSNTLRHSKADRIDIFLQRYGNDARMTVRDNGIGFEHEEKKQASYGLLTMEERVNVLGGAIQLITAPGEGVTIDVWVPLTVQEGRDIGANGVDGTDGDRRTAN
ncbi:sensor histidine kinase [Paenibacillus sp. GCM10027626]|uniref:sensor histidine kinase n=1 Tax=Paenibacillus sp. GCM10027626 TaxID=3273411 RepID=UPI0036370085